MKRILNTPVLLWLVVVSVLMQSFSCNPDKDENSAPHETGIMTDIENHVYQTVKIGNQWWMAEDLKVTKYRNGDPVVWINLQSQSQSDSLQWATDTMGAYCNNYDNANIIIGKLYNWHAIKNAGKLAPAGWHIPTDNEWKELEKYLGMNSTEADKQGWRGTHEGEKLKIEAPKGWTQYGDVWGNNESGFSAMAVGCRLFNSALGEPGLFSTSSWWSSTSYSGNDAFYRNLDYKYANVFRSHCSKNYGYSVRCVKD